jgi:hypothetical protein
MNSNQTTRRLVSFKKNNSKQHRFVFELGILVKIQFSSSAFDYVNCTPN